MHAIRTLVLLIVAGASIAKPLARHARHSGTHHPQKVHPIPVAHGKSKATRQDRGQPAAGQRQCQPLVKNGEISPAASMVDPTIKLLLMSSPKAGATLVERLMLAALNFGRLWARSSWGGGFCPPDSFPDLSIPQGGV